MRESNSSIKKRICVCTSQYYRTYALRELLARKSLIIHPTFLLTASLSSFSVDFRFPGSIAFFVSLQTKKKNNSDVLKAEIMFVKRESSKRGLAVTRPDSDDKEAEKGKSRIVIKILSLPFREG